MSNIMLSQCTSINMQLHKLLNSCLYVCIYPRINCQGYQRASSDKYSYRKAGIEPGTLRFRDNHEAHYATEARLLIKFTLFIDRQILQILGIFSRHDTRYCIYIIYIEIHYVNQEEQHEMLARIAYYRLTWASLYIYTNLPN